MLDSEFFVAGELQPLGIQAFAYQAGQPGFENTHVALLEQVDSILVNVHADHIVADFRQYRCLHQADITATKHTDFHGTLLDSGARAGRELMVMTPRMTNATPRLFVRLNVSLNSGRLAASKYTNA
ncbi:hypothetical protein D3C85_523800 [compost metagenome]